MDEQTYAHDTVRRVRDIEQASPDGRLPVPSYADWDSFPYEGELRVRPVEDVVLPEPPRSGEGGVDCGACAAPDDQYVWTDADWRLRSTDEPTGLPVVLLLEPRVHADLHDLPPAVQAGMGDVLVRVEAAVRSLGGIARVHVMRIGDGAEHLHWWFMARPAGLLQARGSFAVEWDDILPPRPVDEWKADLQRVAAALD
jgi:diadenosine tetraphosphate (Ap4A) HIT family hydrolase